MLDTVEDRVKLEIPEEEGEEDKLPPFIGDSVEEGDCVDDALQLPTPTFPLKVGVAEGQKEGPGVMVMVVVGAAEVEEEAVEVGVPFK